MAAAFLAYYFFAHQNLDKSYGKLVKKSNELEKELANAHKEIAELKRFPKPSDPSKLDAALSEIDDLKSRLRIAEAVAHDATEKAKLANSVREERKHYFDKYCEAIEENRKLKEDIKAIKQKTPRPLRVYSDSEVEKQIIEYKNKLNQKDEDVKKLRVQLSVTQSMLEHTKEDLQDLLDTTDELTEEIRTLRRSVAQPDEYTSLIKESIPRLSELTFAQLPADFKESISSGRLNNAFKSNLMILDKIDMEAKIKSDKETYKTTLNSCTCPDFTFRHNVCKHMLFLSYTSGLLLLNKEVAEKISKNNY